MLQHHEDISDRLGLKAIRHVPHDRTTARSCLLPLQAKQIFEVYKPDDMIDGVFVEG
jgi:hypothetical protein